MSDASQLKNYEDIETIGMGAFGTVKLAYCKIDSK